MAKKVRKLSLSQQLFGTPGSIAREGAKGEYVEVKKKPAKKKKPKKKGKKK